MSKLILILFVLVLTDVAYRIEAKKGKKSEEKFPRNVVGQPTPEEEGTLYGVEFDVDKVVWPPGSPKETQI